MDLPTSPMSSQLSEDELRSLLRRQGISAAWVPATSLGLGVGLAAGAALLASEQLGLAQTP